MRSGAKNVLVDIMSRQETTHPDYNTPLFVFAAWKENVFAHAEPRRGREIEMEGQVVAETYMRFDFDYFDAVGITETMVVRHEGILYDVKGVLPDLGTKEFITVDTVAIGAATDRA